MKNDWEIFEEEAYYYLDSHFSSNYNVDFKHFGSSNSNDNDIDVFKNKNYQFSVEVKLDIAQSSQFVVNFDKKNSIFSIGNSNKSENNIYSKKIIAELNSDNKYSDYAYTGDKSGITIDIDDSIGFKWIKSTYINSNIKFLMTKYNNKPIIMHIDNLERYLDITPRLRPKYSGSRPVSLIRERTIMENIINKYPKSNISFSDFVRGKKHLNLKTNQSLFESKVEKHIYNYDGIPSRYQIRKIDTKRYNIRLLSTTANPTVIFEIKCVRPQMDEDIKLFKNSLK